MKTLLRLLILLLFITGCANSGKEDFVAPSRELSGNKIITDQDSSLIFSNYNAITVVNGVVYIYNSWGGYFFTKYDVANNKAYRFCQQGRGDNEVINVTSSITSVTKENNNYISVFDNFNNNFLYFKENYEFDKNSIINESFSNNVGGLIYYIFPINDSITLATGEFGKNICMFYKNGIVQEAYLESFTKLGDDNRKRILRDANRFDLSPNKEYFVRVTQQGGLIEAYKVENMQLIQQFSYAYFDVICDENLAINEDSRYGYIDVAITDDKIYGLYDGGLILRENTYRSNEVHVYDMSGNPLEKLLLDQYVTSIGVNNKSTHLYAISADGDLFSFNL